MELGAAILGAGLGAVLNGLWRAFFWSSDAVWSKYELWRPLTWLEHFTWALVLWILSLLVWEGFFWTGLVLMIDESVQDHPFAIGSGHELQTYLIGTILAVLLAIIIILKPAP
jgi:hypothetical protein